ncbi:MAG TPA: DUF1585 domain-containing protein, partial [Nannocystaceae bacterium]|nr:DUF1585 domain-containing protein [Nannocystaceae bacterium]
ELAVLLQDDPRFTSCLTDKLYGYALGRELVSADARFLGEIDEELQLSGGSLDRLIELVVVSAAFRMRPEQTE